MGLVLERGSDNVFIGWDESADRVTVGTGSFTGASTGNLTISEANFRASQITTSYTNNSGGVARNIYQSTSAKVLVMVKLEIYGYFTHKSS